MAEVFIFTRCFYNRNVFEYPMANLYNYLINYLDLQLENIF